MACGNIEFSDVKPLIGSRVAGSKDTLLSGKHAAVLRDMLERRGVLIFPQVHFTEAEQISFTRTLGKYEPDRPDERATAISLDPDSGANADYIRNSFFWHFDGYMNDVPILASALACVKPSWEGGQTEFANTYAAWESLPDHRKAQIDGLRAVHALAAAQRSVEPEPSVATFARWQQVRSNALPLVWRHRSGRRSLVIGNTAVGVLGMDPLESLELLVWLRDWSTQDQFCISHNWCEGDCVLWDNTGTLHRARPYPENSGRLMLRTKLAGEEPFALL